jgi:hypothetical protein
VWRAALFHKQVVGPILIVITGLVAGHPSLHTFRKKDVDGRDELGHDES